MNILAVINTASGVVIAGAIAYGAWRVGAAAKGIDRSVGMIQLAFSEFAWPLGGLVYDLGGVSGPFTEWVERELEKEGIYGFDDDDDMPPPCHEDDETPPGTLQ